MNMNTYNRLYNRIVTNKTPLSESDETSCKLMSDRQWRRRTARDSEACKDDV